MFSFAISEFQDRLKNTKQRMAAAGIDVMVVTDPANMNYLTGYDGWSFYVHQLVLVFIDEEQPMWVGRKQDANGARVTTWLSNENIFPYPEDHVQSTVKHPMDFVCEILKQIGQANRTVGVEMDAYYFTAQCYERLKAGLPQAKFKDGTNLINWVRVIKSPQEIEFMKRAAGIAELAMGAAVDSIREGVRECDVVAKISSTQIAGTPEYGGDYPAIVPLLPSGEKTSTPHLTWTDETYKAGDPVIIELAGCYKRYHCPMSRTVVVGQPAPKLQELADVVIEGLNTTLDAIRPGMTASDVEAVWRASIEKHGYEKESRIGYSMGLNYPPDWGEHTASLRNGDTTILAPNMTFHLIPGIWLDKYGVEFSEAIRITETGCETFAHFPRKLFVN